MRRRNYFPHPGPRPTLEASRRRWTGNGKHPRGESPYASFPTRARVGDAPFEEPINPRAGETMADLMVRLERSGKIKTWAAYATARGLLGFDHLSEGINVVHAAELHAHRQSARFLTDPTPVRGKLLKCTSPANFRKVFPSVAVNVSALRHLEWGPELRPQDIFLLWLLIAATFAGIEELPISLLRNGFGVSRPREALKRIASGTFALNHGPNAPRIKHPILMDDEFHEQLFEAIRPRAGGENYGYLDLYILGQMSARWQEKALRGLLATAVKTRIFWNRGGEAQWRISVSESAELFGLSGRFSVDRLRKERLAPLVALLEQDALPLMAALDGVPFYQASRVRLSFEILRDGSKRGRPATGVMLTITILGSDPREDPKGGYARERTADRSRRQPTAAVAYQGLDHELSADDLRLRRSDAAKRGWQKRRRRLGRLPTLMGPRRPSPAALAEALGRLSGATHEPIELPLEILSVDDKGHDTLDLARSYPEWAYGMPPGEYVLDWDDLVESYVSASGS